MHFDQGGHPLDGIEARPLDCQDFGLRMACEQDLRIFGVNLGIVGDPSAQRSSTSGFYSPASPWRRLQLNWAIRNKALSIAPRRVARAAAGEREAARQCTQVPRIAATLSPNDKGLS